MVLYGSNDGIPSSGSNSPTECQEEVCAAHNASCLNGPNPFLSTQVCSFMVTKHSWKGKYKVCRLFDFTYFLLTCDVSSGYSAWARPPSPPTTRARWSRPTPGTTRTSSASSPPQEARSVTRSVSSVIKCRCRCV